MTVADLVDQIDDFENLAEKEQIKLLSYFYCIANKKEYFSTFEIKEQFEQQRLESPQNISFILTRLTKTTPPIIVADRKGWMFHRAAKKLLDEIYIGSAPKKIVSIPLREMLNEINDFEQKRFFEEAINCFEIKAYRASILMAWQLTLDVLHTYILTQKLKDFNEAIKEYKHTKYINKEVIIKEKDDFSDIKESDFIQICKDGKIITGDIKKILDDKLRFRNICAHTNSIVVRESIAVAFIEDLIINIIKKYEQKLQIDQQKDGI